MSFAPGGGRAKPLKSKRYYLERAGYLRRLATQAQTEALRKTCLKEAEECEALARDAEKAEADADQE
jgi:hypothetical protein